MRYEIRYHGYKDYFYGELEVALSSLEMTERFYKTIRLGVFPEGQKLNKHHITKLLHFLELFAVSVDIKEETEYWTMSFTYLGNEGEENIVKLRFWHNYANLFLNGICKDPTLLINNLCREIAKQEERQAKLYEASINN